MHTRLGVQMPLVFLSLLGLGGAAFAQGNHPLSQQEAASLLMVAVVGMFVVYLYMALALQTIAAKTNTDNAWLAWIPIVNLVLLLNVARKPVWWILLFFVPLVNLIIAVVVWMGVAEARGKESWLGILMVVPILNLFLPGYLAWAD